MIVGISCRLVISIGTHSVQLAAKEEGEVCIGQLLGSTQTKSTCYTESYVLLEIINKPPKISY